MRRKSGGARSSSAGSLSRHPVSPYDAQKEGFIRCSPSVFRSHPIPDPRQWPAEVCASLRELKGDGGLRDVVVFNHGPYAEMRCDDAVTALGLLDVKVSEWSVVGGFPTFTFDPAKIEDYYRQLAWSGYRMRVFHPLQDGEDQSTKGQATTPRADLIDIATARERLQKVKTKGVTA